MTQDPSSIQVIGPEAGERVDVLGAPVLIKSEGSPGFLFLADHPVPPGYGVPLHVHSAEDEVFYVLEGEITLDSEVGSMTAGPGTFVHLPRGVAHGFRNASGAEARMLVVATPGGGLEGVFRGLDALGRQGEPTPDTVAAVCAANGVNMRPAMVEA